MKRTSAAPDRRVPGRRGVALVTVLLIVMFGTLLVTTAIVSGGRHHDLSVRRHERVQAFYASEAGSSLAIREVMMDEDEDGDGGIGTISDDDDDATDPAFGIATVSVSREHHPDHDILACHGAAGDTRVLVEVLIE